MPPITTRTRKALDDVTASRNNQAINIKQLIVVKDEDRLLGNDERLKRIRTNNPISNVNVNVIANSKSTVLAPMTVTNNKPLKPSRIPELVPRRKPSAAQIAVNARTAVTARLKQEQQQQKQQKQNQQLEQRPAWGQNNAEAASRLAARRKLASLYTITASSSSIPVPAAPVKPAVLVASAVSSKETRKALNNDTPVAISQASFIHAPSIQILSPLSVHIPIPRPNPTRGMVKAGLSRPYHLPTVKTGEAARERSYNSLKQTSTDAVKTITQRNANFPSIPSLIPGKPSIAAMIIATGKVFPAAPLSRVSSCDSGSAFVPNSVASPESAVNSSQPKAPPPVPASNSALAPALAARARRHSTSSLPDPLLLSEYADEIHKHILEMERKTTPDPQYIKTHPQITWEMRKQLVNWLMILHSKLGLHAETLFLAVNLTDRFMSLNPHAVAVDKFQLVGVTAMLIAAKYEEIKAPSVQVLVVMVGSGYSAQEILNAEKFMLDLFGFSIGYSGPCSLLTRILTPNEADEGKKTSEKTQQCEYQEQEIIECAKALYITLARIQEDDGVYIKFMDAKYSHAAVFVKEFIESETNQ
ncbi:hypothetical protein HK100_001084 [Physocladia obscura]|uniref:Cyclin-like domain-containing protein n=1 Tax=Physocladia obscura TaxID=109957 RepID=A0AAD5SZ70_9FUNG|nr:hypothetical protein HK100_001084 [Physocladia obscura]